VREKGPLTWPAFDETVGDAGGSHPAKWRAPGKQLMASTRAQNIFNKAVREYGITEGGRNWLIQAIDPYHDEVIPQTGFPDNNISGSIVQQVKQSFTIQAPAGASGNWDCNVFNLPHQVETFYSGYGSLGVPPYDPIHASIELYDHSAVANGVVAGGVCAVYGDPSGASATAGGFNLSAYAGRVVSDTSIGFQSSDLNAFSYWGGNARVVAMGFEVINTTAELYKQGMVTYYRQPVARDCLTAIQFQNPAQTQFRTISTHLLYDAPNSESLALKLKGSTQTEAKEGGYCVCTMNGIDNPPGPTLPNSYFFTGSQYSTTSTIGGTAAGKWTSTDGFTFSPCDGPRYNMSGMFFKGLSQQTTLTVNVIWYIERFPSTAEQTLVVLAKPSVGYDAVALEMYARCLAMMPSGVPQKENGLGDWFRDVVAAIPKVARTIAPALGMLPLPGAQIASGIAQAVGRIGEAPGQTYSPNGAHKQKKKKKKGGQQGMSIQQVEKALGRKLTQRQIQRMSNA